MLLAVVAGFKSHHAKHKRISATRTISPFRVHNNSRPSNPSSMKAIHNKMEQPHTLVLIRLLYMIYSMAIGCVQPFLSVYYRSLGHGGEIIGLIMSISPFTSFLVGPIWGLITDKVQQPFLILYITTMMSMIGQLLVYQMDEPRHIMVMVCITSLFSTPVKPLIDSLVMMRLSDRSQFGKLRLFSILGTGIATSIAGSFLKMEDHIDYFPIHEGDSMRDSLTRFWQSLVGYKLLFFAYTVLHIPTFFCIRLFQKAHEAKGTPTKETEKKKEQPPIRMKDVVAIVLQDKKVIFFFSLVYIMGISSGMGENFVYIRFQEVGGTGANMGMSRLLSSIGGAAMFWHSGKISSALGMERVMALSLAIVATRFTLLYFMKNIYFGYLAEFFRGMTFGCFWSSSIVYASQLAPPELQVTMVRETFF
jgi:PPP family 3-phenylpropionic acid transporter